MSHSLFIITGANKGFGEVLAQTIASSLSTTDLLRFILIGRHIVTLESVAHALQRQSHVLSVDIIAESHGLDNAATTFDMVLRALDPVISSVIAEVGCLTLINNAGMTGDLGQKVGAYQPSDIQSYIDMNVTSYITLVSGVLQLYQSKWKASARSLRLVNISSLLAVQPFSHWGLYATGKAARDMLMGVIAKENEARSSIRTLSYAPGPLENDMQRRVRDTLGDPEQLALYTDMAKKGTLVSMEDSAKKLVGLLKNDNYTSGAHIDYFDV